MLLLTKESPFVRFPSRRLPSLGAKAAPRKANSLFIYSYLYLYRGRKEIECEQRGFSGIDMRGATSEKLLPMCYL
jgi:hypothetical protein